MNGALIFSGSSPLVILTSHKHLEDERLLERLERKGIKKFIGFSVPVDLLRQRYGVHYDIVSRDLHETDDLRVLDFDGRRAMDLLPFDSLGDPVYHGN
ncbi:MAG: cytosolic protein [Planctomycetota bacterium]|jgi:hypothetical protein